MFVGNRVAEVREASTTAQWRFVPGKLNVSDLGTRGANMDDLTIDSAWLNGPSFLKEGEESWPVMPEISFTFRCIGGLMSNLSKSTKVNRF